MVQPRTGQRIRADRRTVRTDSTGPVTTTDGGSPAVTDGPVPREAERLAPDDGASTAAPDGLVAPAAAEQLVTADGPAGLGDSPPVPGPGLVAPGRGQLTEGDGARVRTPLGQLAWSDLDRAVRSAQNWEPEPGPGGQTDQGLWTRDGRRARADRWPRLRANRGERAQADPGGPGGGLQALLAGDGAVLDDSPELVPGEALVADVRRRALAWAHRRSLGLSSASGISIALAACAATWFSAGTLADNFRGVAAMCAGYLVLLAGKSLARQSDAAGSRRWLAALGARLSECAIYAGLAAGAAAQHWPGAWTLAIAVLGLVSVRDLMTTCSSPPGLGAHSGTGVQDLVRAVLTMPPGGRVLLILLTAPGWGARVALLALLDWAIISVGYGIAGRAVPALQEDLPKLVRLRDDGAIARTLGTLVRGQLQPLPPTVLGVAAVATMVGLGLHGLPSILIAGPAIVMLLAAPGSSNRHGGRFDWLVPVLLLAAQMLYVAAAGLATGVPGPLIFLLCGALLLRYADISYPGRPVWLAPPRQPGADQAERGTSLGWEGRLLIVGVAAALGIAMYAYIALSVYLGLLICAKAVMSCLQRRDDSGADRLGGRPDGVTAPSDGA